MKTESELITSARAQYRAAFRHMAAGGDWHLYASSCGVVLDLAGAQSGALLVAHVQAMAENTLAVRLSAALRKGVMP